MFAFLVMVTKFCIDLVVLTNLKKQSTIRFYKPFPLYLYVKQVTRGAGPTLTRGHDMNKHGSG